MGGAGQSEGRWRTSELAIALGAGRLHMQLGTCAATTCRSSFVIETPRSKVRVKRVIVVEQGSHHASWSIARLNCELLNAPLYIQLPLLYAFPRPSVLLYAFPCPRDIK